MKTYRDNGAIGALLDEYELALFSLDNVIKEVTQEQLIKIVDAETKDKDCRSIQTILSHVVFAGYGYNIAIRNWEGEQLERISRKTLSTIDEYKIALNDMFNYTLDVFKDYPNIKLEEYDSEKNILMSWGQKFDVDQLMEHAIVHILRHRRQIERFLLKLNEN